MLARFMDSSTSKIKQVYNWLFINQCHVCGQASAAALCSACASDLPKASRVCPNCAEFQPLNQVCGQCLRQPPAFSRVIAPFYYQHPVRRHLRNWKLKQGRQPVWLFAALAEQLGDYEFDAIVPIPCHWRRKLRRGHDHTKVLARFIAQFTAQASAYAARLQSPPLSASTSKSRPKPVICALQRARYTHTQRGLDRSARLKNVRDSFKLIHPVQDLRVLLIDDVITTGSTAHAAATVLKQHGARSVVLGCLAKTPKRIR